MAVEYKGIREVLVNGGTSITIQIPAGASEGDLLIAYIAKDDNVAIYTDGDYSKWTMLCNVISDSQTCLYVAWRIATADDVSGAVSWTWNADSEDWVGEILCYSGADTTTPIHASDSAYLDSSATPTAPSVAFTDLTAGSLVFQCFGCDFDDTPRVMASGLTSRFNQHQANDIGGAGGDKVGDWVSPTGFNDPESAWTTETNAYDEDTEAGYAWANSDPESWGPYCEWTHAAMECDKIRFWAYYWEGRHEQVSIDVYYSDDWYNIYEGTFAHIQWVEKEIGSTQIVTAVRFKFYNTDTVEVQNCALYEIDFFQTTSGTGNTGTAVFGIPASNEWTAFTAVIEAAAGGGVQALLSTVAIATSITSSLSRGAIEALVSTANIVSSITSSLTRGITQALNSTSDIVSSITGSLSRGVTEALTSTSAITSSITGRLTKIINLVSTSPIVISITSVLSRGITKALTSTSNIATSITGSISRGVTQALVSTSNIATSITSSLSRGITATLVSTANMATSITSSLSRGITQALISTANGVVSFTSSLSRGVTEALTSTANIVVSITANLTKSAGETIQLISTAIISVATTSSLSRGITESLISTANIVTSLTSSLSRGITESLVSTVNIVSSFTSKITRIIDLVSTSAITTSITGMLSRGITEALNSTSVIVTSFSAKLRRIVKLISTSVLTISITSALSRGITESLTSTANVVTSIIASLSKIGTVLLASVANIVCVIGGEVDVGSEAINRTGWAELFDTYVDASNPANASGTIKKIELFAHEAAVNVKVATFYVVSGNYLSTRDYEIIASVPVGYSSHTVSLNVQAGDYIGFYGLEVDSVWSGGYGFRYPADNKIPCENVEFVLKDDIHSIYGTTSGIILGRGITEVLTSTSPIVTLITSTLSRGIKEVLASTTNIAISITSVLSRGITELLTSTSVIITSMTGNLSRGIKAVLASTVSITTSLTSALSRGIIQALNSTSSIAISIISILVSIQHWWKTTKETAVWTKVEKEKEECTKVEKDKDDWIGVSKGTDDWIKVNKEKEDWNKVDK